MAPRQSTASRRARFAEPPLAGIRLERRSPAAVARRLRALVEDGARVLPAGRAPGDLARLFAAGYAPRCEVALFGVRFFLTGFRYDDYLNFLVAYVALPEPDGRVRAIHPRIFYKDLSLAWRAASHVCTRCGELWIGKGETRWERRKDGLYEVSAEETTNLPLELQGALDAASQAARARRDARALRLFLRDSPADRIAAYADFSAPRERARAGGEVHGGRPIARFRRRLDPGSLSFADGFAPDFARVIEVRSAPSHLYGGAVRKYRVCSRNGEVQHQFLASPTHVWLNPPQTLTRELTTYGVRTLDVRAPEELCVPGFEYHFVDETRDPPELHSQIPPGFAGEPSCEDPLRADASRWNEALPVIREFRRKVLGARR